MPRRRGGTNACQSRCASGRSRRQRGETDFVLRTEAQAEWPLAACRRGKPWLVLVMGDRSPVKARTPPGESKLRQSLPRRNAAATQVSVRPGCCRREQPLDDRPPCHNRPILGNGSSLPARLRLCRAVAQAPPGRRAAGRVGPPGPFAPERPSPELQRHRGGPRLARPAIARCVPPSAR